MTGYTISAEEAFQPRLSVRDSEDGIVFAGVMGDSRGYRLADDGSGHGTVVDFHRVDGLGKVAGVALDVDLVADVQFAIGKVDGDHVNSSEVVGYFSDFFLRHFRTLLVLAGSTRM